VHPTELPLARGEYAALAEGSGPLDVFLILPLLNLLGRRRRDALLARSSLAPVARPLDPRRAPPGLPDWRCVPTPGHTPGHVSFFRPRDRVLVTGDALVTLRVNSFWGLLLGRAGLSGPPWYTTWSWEAAKQSVDVLARLEPEVMVAGHGHPMIGAETARELHAFAERLLSTKGSAGTA
jgi:glyoxylase-like metal-dependent hydrolase (beta-lactamase superfamily II)